MVVPESELEFFNPEEMEDSHEKGFARKVFLLFNLCIICYSKRIAM